MTTLRRFAAWLVLTGFVATQSAVAIEARHESLLDDAACLVESGAYITGAHHQFGAQIERKIPAPPLEHCAVCHAQRTLSHARPTSAAVTLAAPAVLLATSGRALAPVAHVHARAIPRGPPAAL